MGSPKVLYLYVLSATCFPIGQHHPRLEHGPGSERGSDSLPAYVCLHACTPLRTCRSFATRLSYQLTLYQLGSNPAAKMIQALGKILPKTLSLSVGLTRRQPPFLPHLINHQVLSG